MLRFIPLGRCSSSHCSRAMRATPSDTRRRRRLPAAAARLPGSSAETGSLARTTCVWTTRSVRVNWNSTAPTSRVSPADSRSHTSSVAASVGALPASTRRTSGLDASSRRSAVSRYRSGADDHRQTGSSVSSPFGLLVKHPAADVSARLRIEQPDEERRWPRACRLHSSVRAVAARSCGPVSCRDASAGRRILPARRARGGAQDPDRRSHESFGFHPGRSWTIDDRLRLLLEEPREFAQLFEGIPNGRQRAPEIVGREAGPVRSVSRADLGRGRQVGGIDRGARIFIRRTWRRPPAVPISLFRSVVILLDLRQLRVSS